MAVLKIYNDIQTEDQKNSAKFWGEAEGVCFKDIDAFIESMAADDNKIDIRLHCDGGSCQEGWAIYDRLRATGKEIWATVEGNAASMATVILMAAPKERRRAYQSASICVHNPWVCPWALGDQVNADDLQKYANNLRAEQNKMVDLYVERCGCDRDEIQSLMNEDKYIDTDRALQLGIIGSIIPPASASKKDPKNTAHSTQHNINNKKQNNMAKQKNEGKIEVKSSILDKMLAKLGFKTIDEVTFGMDLNTADGQTLTVEREEGEPQVGDAASPDGTFSMPDGSTITVKDGVITEIKPADGGGDGSGDGKKGEGSGGDGDSTGDDDKDAKIAELQQQVDDLTAENEELKQKVEDAGKNAKTTEDLRILNAVKMAGGEKALAKISSSYKPQPRKPNGKNASNADEGAKGDWAQAVAAEKEAMKKKFARKKD